jgi:hypothetical protein
MTKYEAVNRFRSALLLAIRETPYFDSFFQDLTPGFLIDISLVGHFESDDVAPLSFDAAFLRDLHIAPNLKLDEPAPASEPQPEIHEAAVAEPDAATRWREMLFSLIGIRRRKE